MKHLYRSFAIASFGITSAMALDLTPEPTFREQEGFRIPIVCFQDAGKKISYQPPAKWNLSGGGATLSLYPPNIPDSVMQFRVRAYKAGEPGQTEDLEKWCNAQLPQDAAEPKVAGEAANIFTLGTLPSRELSYSYVAQGRRFITSVTVVDWNERERLALVVTAREADFPRVHDAAMRSMFSWNKQ